MAWGSIAGVAGSRASRAFTVEANCRIDLGPVTTVPYTLLDPAAA
jgi:hypothetical protein